MLIKNESVNAICAFPPDGMILSVNPLDLIVTRDWKVTHYISDPDSGNDMKRWQAILPFFDFNECPFVVSSGEASYNLINVKSGKMQVLASGSADNWSGQQAVCFSR